METLIVAALGNCEEKQDNAQKALGKVSTVVDNYALPLKGHCWFQNYAKGNISPELSSTEHSNLLQIKGYKF